MNVDIALTEKLDQYIRDKVASGLYSDASELVREALREKIAREQEGTAFLAELRAEIDEGWREAESGEFADFDPHRISRELNAELNG